jgi:hypothetical protein
MMYLSYRLNTPTHHIVPSAMYWILRGSTDRHRQAGGFQVGVTRGCGVLFPPLRGGWQRLQALTGGVRQFPLNISP